MAYVGRMLECTGIPVVAGETGLRLELGCGATGRTTTVVPPLVEELVAGWRVSEWGWSVRVGEGLDA